MDIHTLWEKVSAQIKENIGKTPFETWILPLKPTLENETSLIVEAPDAFFRDWVEKHYKQLIQETVRNLTKKAVIVTLGSADQDKNVSIENTSVHLPGPASETNFCSNLNPRYTFENFVVGASNRHAHAYSLAVAESPAKTYNPLFIYGAAGLGKTHLMQAICHKIKSHNQPVKICYMPSERFTTELIEAIQHHSTSKFRQRYRNMDVLVIDDIHFIAGKESTQEEFFHTFNALHDAHKQIILCSDRPPREISNLQDRLVSRFSWGLSTDIQPPDFETRIAILKKKIEREPVTVPEDVIYFIAQLIKTNIRELEGALVRIIAYSLLEEKVINLDLAKDVLKDLLREPKKLITVDFIQRCIAEEFGISLQDLKNKRRNKTVVFPRQIAMYISRELTDLSLPEIGAFFGGKDHTTVLHAYNKIKEGLEKDEVLKNRITRVIQGLRQ